MPHCSECVWYVRASRKEKGADLAVMVARDARSKLEGLEKQADPVLSTEAAEYARSVVNWMELYYDHRTCASHEGEPARPSDLCVNQTRFIRREVKE